VSGLTMVTGVALFSILTNVIGRSLPATLYGEDSEEAPAPETRKAAASKLRAAGASVLAVVTRTVDAAGSIPGVRSGSPPGWLAHGLGRIVWNAYNDIHSVPYEWTSKVVTAAIFVSVGCIMVESVESIHTEYYLPISAAEWIVSLVFVLDYVAQMWIAENRRAYATSFWGVIDLVAIIPGNLPDPRHDTGEVRPPVPHPPRAARPQAHEGCHGTGAYLSQRELRYPVCRSPDLPYCVIHRDGHVRHADVVR